MNRDGSETRGKVNEYQNIESTSNDSRASWGWSTGPICCGVEGEVVLVLEPMLTEHAEVCVPVTPLSDPLPLLGPLLVVQQRHKVLERQTCRPQCPRNVTQGPYTSGHLKFKAIQDFGPTKFKAFQDFQDPVQTLT